MPTQRRSRCTWKVAEGSAMVPPMASARNRQAVRPRAHREDTARSRCARAGDDRSGTPLVSVLTALLSAVLLLTLLLTAFGTWSPDPVASQPARRRRPCSRAASRCRRSSPRRAPLQLQLPVAQSAVTAIGYHHAGNGSLTLDPVGRQGNAGLFARIWHRLAGASENRLVWYQLRGDRGPGTSALVGRRRARHRRLLAGGRDGRRDHRLRALEPDVRRPHRHPAARRAFGRRLAHAPPRRPGADRRLGRRRRPARRSASSST